MFTILTGSQFGDEGKGKIVDVLAPSYDIIARFQGGDNAGHTVKVKGEVFKLHTVPSGVLYDVRLLIGPWVVVNPEVLLGEIAQLEEGGVVVDAHRLGIDAKTSIIMPYHIVLDELFETRRSKKIGTTKRGIAYAYIDKTSRDEVQFADLSDRSRLKEKLDRMLPAKRAELEHMGATEEQLERALTADWLFEAGEKLSMYCTDVSREVSTAIARGKNVLAEGAQGTHLDVVHGTQKFVTSSSTLAGSACISLGVGPMLVDEVVGVVKAYITRVGEGPLPTEQHGEAGEHMQQVGGEYGTTTGRARRCGWFDVPLLKKSIVLNGYSSLVLTKLDVLTGLNPVRICTSYELDGELIHYPPELTSELERCTPVYEDVEGWSDDISGIKTFDELPDAALSYVRRLEEMLGVPVSMVSVGASREQMIQMEGRDER
ncbi:MAG: adenylosuccinate synthase [Methermicoccaceae archaeon]